LDLILTDRTKKEHWVVVLRKAYRKAHLPCTKEPISTQSGKKNDNLDDINKTTGNIRSRILDIGLGFC